MAFSFYRGAISEETLAKAVIKIKMKIKKET
jgi:hypothetical protein